MSTVAGCAPLTGATAQHPPDGRNSGATQPKGGNPSSPMTGQQLRAQLRVQLGRNTPATSGPVTEFDGCTPELDNQLARSWLVRFPNCNPMEVIFAPEATRAEVEAIYRGARIEPLPEAIRRAATAAEADELRTLVSLLYADADETDRAEALTIALADPEAALASFRALTGKL